MCEFVCSILERIWLRANEIVYFGLTGYFKGTNIPIRINGIVTETNWYVRIRMFHRIKYTITCKWNRTVMTMKDFSKWIEWKIT